ncbi:MAG: flagellar motor protein MotA, partial [Xanthobacteraceae bacterium]
MAQDIDPFKLSSPRIFLVRMTVFLILCALVVIVLNKQIWLAFLANPGLNALIIGVLLIGIALSFRQVIRLFPEVNWVNGFRLADPGLAVERPPVLLAPMAAILGDRIGRMTISSQMMRGLLDSIATRLDEARDMSR